MANLLRDLLPGGAQEPAMSGSAGAPGMVPGAVSGAPVPAPEEIPEIPLLDEKWAAEIQDTSWLTDIAYAVRLTPLEFFGNLFLDLALGGLVFGVLWFLVERWAQDARAAIAKRELWDEAQKQGELERTTLLRRYLVTASAFVGLCLALGSFSLRYRVPVIQTLARTVQTWLWVGGLSRIIAILIVGSVVYALLRVVRKTARALTPVSGQRFERQVARAATIRSVVESSARLVLITFFILFVLAQLGVNVTTLLAGVGILGLAISFGAQSLVKDVITGFFILAEDQFGVGDVVTIAGLSGAVESLNLRITTLRALDGQVHVIPNGQIDKVTVASKDWSRSVVDLEVAYRADLDRALSVIGDEATQMTTALGWSWRITGPPEVTGVEALGGSGIVVRVIFKTLPKEQWGVSREFRRRIKLRLDAEGIEIPYPHLTLYWGEQQNPARFPTTESRGQHEPDRDEP